MERLQSGALSHTSSGEGTLKSAKPLTLMTHVPGSRGWMRLDDKGRISNVQVDKHGLVMELGVPYRDLRMLDPLVPMPYPSSIFIREKALVVNLESIRMLICEDQVYVLSVPAVGQPGAGKNPDQDHYFIKDLVVRLQAGQINADGSPLNRESMNLPLDRHMPYELKALECALAVAVRILSRDCAELDAEARSPLERLTHKVNKADLQRVRNVKAIMNKLMGRVGRIKQELERILDDDADMADMYLGRRRHLEALEEMTHPGSPKRMSSLLSQPTQDLFGLARPKRDSEEADWGAGEQRRGGTPPLKVPGASPRGGSEDVEFRPHSAEEAAAVLAHLDEIRRTQAGAGVVDPHDIEACEALLESYFMQVDYLMNGLVMLKEHVDDTEDLINIELDNRRNELVALNMVVGSATASLSVIAACASVFGMNLYPLPVDGGDSTVFTAVTVSAVGTAVLVFLSIIGYAWLKKLLFVASAQSMGAREGVAPAAKQPVAL